MFYALAAGGGIRSIEDVRALLKAGADKVVVNTAAVTDPHLLTGDSQTVWDPEPYCWN